MGRKRKNAITEEAPKTEKPVKSVPKIDYSIGVAASIDVSIGVEVKNNFDFLNWMWCWRIVKENYPNANYEFVTHFNPVTGRQESYIPVGENGGLIATRCTLDGENWLEMKMAITEKDDERFDLPKEITASHVQNAYYRALVKNFSMFGIGIDLYLPINIQNERTNLFRYNYTQAIQAQQQQETVAEEVVEEVVEEQVQEETKPEPKKRGRKPKVQAPIAEEDLDIPEEVIEVASDDIPNVPEIPEEEMIETEPDVYAPVVETASEEVTEETTEEITTGAEPTIYQATITNVTDRLPAGTPEDTLKVGICPVHNVPIFFAIKGGEGRWYHQVVTADGEKALCFGAGVGAWPVEYKEK